MLSIPGRRKSSQARPTERPCSPTSVPPRPLLPQRSSRCQRSNRGQPRGQPRRLQHRARRLEERAQSHLEGPCSLFFGATFSFSQWAQALPRLLLRTRSSFSRFLLKTFCLRRDDDASISTALFPLPLLCDGLFEKVPQPSVRKHVAILDSRVVHVICMALNFLHSNGRHIPSQALRRPRRLNSARFLPGYVGLLGRATARQGRYLSVQAVRAQLRLPFFPTSSHTLGRPAWVPLRARALRTLGLSLSVPKLSLTPLPALILIAPWPLIVLSSRAEGTGTSPANLGPDMLLPFLERRPQDLRSRRLSSPNV